MGRRLINPWLDFHATPDRVMMINGYPPAFPGGGGGGGIELVATVVPVGGSTSATTAPFDCTGSDFFVAICGDYQTPIVVTDSQGNTYTGLNYQNTFGVNGNRIFYSAAASSSASQTFTATGNSGQGVCIQVYGFKNVNAAPFSSQNGNSSIGPATIQPGSVTPPQDGCLIITGVQCFSGTATNIDLGFTMTVFSAPATNVNAASAYLIQGTAGALNPTWTASGTFLSSTIAVFLPA